MTNSPELERLVAAERAEAPAPGAAERGFERLSRAIAAGAAPIALSAVTAPAAGKTLLVQAATALLLGGSGAGVAVTAWHAAQEPSTPEPARSAPQRAPETSPMLEVAPRAASSAGTEAALPPAPRPSARAGASAPASSAIGAPSTLQAELELLRQAKGALDSGDATTASARLEQHAREFPGGALRLEREALRVLTRCGSDRLTGAAQARAFLRANPGSPLVDRVRSACRLDDDAEIEK